MEEWRLRIGTKLTGFTVRPDSKYPDMWRVHSPDGRISDMVNLSRAKDAARACAHPGGTEVVRWDYRQMAYDRPSSAFAAVGAT